MTDTSCTCGYCGNVHSRKGRSIPEGWITLDGKEIRIARNPKSFTGWSWVSMSGEKGRNEEGELVDKPGIPASAYEVALYREVERLRRIISDLELKKEKS